MTKLIYDLKTLQSSAFSFQPSVLIPGTLDGVHLGHQALIKRAQEEARAIGGKVVVMTFDRHPVSLLRSSVAPALLTTTEQKIKLLQELGVDAVLLLTFDEKLAETPAADFILQITKALPKLHTIVVGASWSFGKEGEGNLELLNMLGEKFHFSVLTIKPIELNGNSVSSTRIRKAIASGDLNNAASCLGRRYSLTGTVIEGNQKAREFGFPTANLLLPAIQLPPDGVYAVTAIVGEKKYQGAANIGHCPTLHDFPFPKTVEVHLFDFVGDLYGQELTMTPIAYLRPEKKFSSVEELRLQIVKDVESVKKIFKKEARE
ncbi:MAG: riboflavin biosynthesis protein RibF [Verrucomicrobia bacterium]|nr:riboflavin biosynthesis protein RibF [Verrucomicrobiota bacterium]